jgi:hypothetical protein
MSSQNGIYFSIIKGLNLIISFSIHLFKLLNSEVFPKNVYSFNKNILILVFNSAPLRLNRSIQNPFNVLTRGTPKQYNLNVFQKSKVVSFIETQANQSVWKNICF